MLEISPSFRKFKLQEYLFQDVKKTLEIVGLQFTDHGKTGYSANFKLNRTK